jgi:hypothetical protein
MPMLMLLQRLFHAVCTTVLQVADTSSSSVSSSSSYSSSSDSEPKASVGGVDLLLLRRASEDAIRACAVGGHWKVTFTTVLFS